VQFLSKKLGFRRFVRPNKIKAPRSFKNFGTIDDATAVPPVFADREIRALCSAVSGGSRLWSSGGLLACIRRRASSKVRGSLGWMD